MKDLKEKVYQISIVYTRPDFGENVEFLKCYSAIKPKNPTELKHIFTESFKQAHPTWTFQHISVR